MLHGVCDSSAQYQAAQTGGQLPRRRGPLVATTIGLLWLGHASQRLRCDVESDTWLLVLCFGSFSSACQQRVAVWDLLELGSSMIDCSMV